jgi:hypothetical protein
VFVCGFDVDEAVRSGIMELAKTRERDSMDIESRLQKIEAQVRQIKILAWVILALVLAFGLGILPAYLPSILVILTLVAMVYLLFVVISGWWQIRTSHQTNAELQDRILRAIAAERAKTRGQDPNP